LDRIADCSSWTLYYYIIYCCHIFFPAPLLGILTAILQVVYPCPLLLYTICIIHSVYVEALYASIISIPDRDQPITARPSVRNIHSKRCSLTELISWFLVFTWNQVIVQTLFLSPAMKSCFSIFSMIFYTIHINNDHQMTQVSGVLILCRTILV